MPAFITLFERDASFYSNRVTTFSNAVKIAQSEAFAHALANATIQKLPPGGALEPFAPVIPGRAILSNDAVEVLTVNERRANLSEVIKTATPDDEYVPSHPTYEYRRQVVASIDALHPLFVKKVLLEGGQQLAVGALFWLSSNKAELFLQSGDNDQTRFQLHQDFIKWLQKYSFLPFNAEDGDNPLIEFSYEKLLAIAILNIGIADRNIAEQVVNESIRKGHLRPSREDDNGITLFTLSEKGASSIF